MSSIMNISGSSISGNCNNKCEYSFNYPNASINVTNNGNMLQMNYNNSPSSQVNFNDTTYNISSFGILSPSSHKYNDSLADAEFFIQHSPVGNGSLLFIYIPISLNGNSGIPSEFISKVITSVSNSAPSFGQTTNSGMKEFSLNKMIPMTSFYSYTDESNNDNIVFGMKNAIYINNDTLSILKKVITEWNEPVNTGPDIFINTKGPLFGNNDGTNDIYIDCQPTDSSSEMVTTSSNEPVNTINNDITFKTISTNPFFLIVVSLIAFVILIFGTQKLIQHINSKN